MTLGQLDIYRSGGIAGYKILLNISHLGADETLSSGAQQVFVVFVVISSNIGSFHVQILVRIDINIDSPTISGAGSSSGSLVLLQGNSLITTVLQDFLNFGSNQLGAILVGVELALLLVIGLFQDLAGTCGNDIRESGGAQCQSHDHGQHSCNDLLHVCFLHKNLFASGSASFSETAFTT